MLSAPTYCPFAPRCRFEVEQSRQELPPLLEIEPGHYVACFNPVPADQWQTRTLSLDADTFAATNQLSVRVPWSALGGCPTQMRLALHVVHGVVGNEWKDLVPSTHTPWQTPGGGYYEIDLTAPAAVASFVLR